MGRDVSDIEDHFQQNKRISIDIGTEVLMQIGGVTGRLASVFVGMETQRYMIFKVPRAQVNLSAKLVRGATVIVRYRFQGRIFGFQTHIIDTVFEPVGLIFLRPPNVVEEHNLRKKQRIDCYFPCEVELDEAVEPGVVVNISMSGCRCIFSSLRSNREVLSALRNRQVKLRVQLAERERSLVLHSKIISAQQFHGAVSAGIQFGELDEESSLSLKAHMAEWM